MQSMMAQLDMPAMTLSVVSLLLFLHGRYGWCAVACTALVLAKETGAVAPAVFGAWLVLHDRNWKQAAWFVLPFGALAIWLLVLWRSTGHLLGDPGFAHYNVDYQLQPGTAVQHPASSFLFPLCIRLSVDRLHRDPGWPS